MEGVNNWYKCLNRGSNFIKNFPFLYTFNPYKIQDTRRKHKNINDTAGSMLCNISLAAYTYKGSFILYTTPQKGRAIQNLFAWGC